MSKVLVTGGLGFVGGRIAQKLSASHQVTVSSRNTVSPPVLALHGPVNQLAHRSLLSTDDFPRGIDTVIHMAALNEHDCVRHPSEAIRVNIDETRIILENSIAAGVRHFIYFSTAHIYASPLKGVITESNLPLPVHPYAITHKAAEDYVVAAALQKKIKAVVVRLSNSFGAPVLPSVNRWTLLANDLCRQAIENKALRLLSNGCQYRDFICLSDVEQVIADMLTGIDTKFNHIIYNLGSGRSMRVIDMANAVAGAYRQLFGQDIQVVLPDGAVPTDEPSLDYSVDRLLGEGCIIKNNVEAEIKELLLFCHKNFSKAG
jgi:UDP-glucose 4-epimerase